MPYLFVESVYAPFSTIITRYSREQTLKALKSAIRRGRSSPVSRQLVQYHQSECPVPHTIMCTTQTLSCVGGAVWAFGFIQRHNVMLRQSCLLPHIMRDQ